MATKLTEDRAGVRKEPYEADSVEVFEVDGNQTVYTNSLVGILSSSNKVEPVDPSNIENYDAIGFTEDHSEPRPANADVEVGNFTGREVKVQFGLAVELDAHTNLAGGEVGKPAYAASDHEFEVSSAADVDGDSTDETLPQIGVVKDTIADATDRAMIELADLA